MNKKILALLMALMMVLTSVAAFAEGNSITITKTYTTAVNGFVPAETLEFTAEFVSFDAADTSAVEVTADNAPVYTGTIAAAAGNSTVTISSDATSFPAAGKYVYTLTETAGDVQGVTYGEEEISFALYVGYDADGALKLLDVGILKDGEGNKNGTITNDYAVGGVEIEKIVTGNAANVTDTFNAVVTVTAAEGYTLPENFEINFTDADNTTAKAVALTKTAATFNVTLKQGTNVVINNLPEGAVVSVAEDDEKVGTDDNQYTSEVSGTAVAAETAGEITVTNTRTTTIDTGVNTDNMPYIMLMAFVMIIAAAVVLKKRTVNE